MKYTYSEIKEKEIELTFPAFIQFSSVYYKMMNKDLLVKVEDFDFAFSIEVRTPPMCNPFGNEGWKFITEEEFNDAHQRVSDKLIQYSPKLETI